MAIPKHASLGEGLRRCLLIEKVVSDTTFAFGFTYLVTGKTKQTEQPSPALFGGTRVTSLSELGEGCTTLWTTNFEHWVLMFRINNSLN
jgi:hypothetical protein